MKKIYFVLLLVGSFIKSSEGEMLRRAIQLSLEESQRENALAKALRESKEEEARRQQIDQAARAEEDQLQRVLEESRREEEARQAQIRAEIDRLKEILRRVQIQSAQGISGLLHAFQEQGLINPGGVFDVFGGGSAPEGGVAPGAGVAVADYDPSLFAVAVDDSDRPEPAKKRELTNHEIAGLSEADQTKYLLELTAGMGKDPVFADVRDDEYAAPRKIMEVDGTPVYKVKVARQSGALCATHAVKNTLYMLMALMSEDQAQKQELLNLLFIDERADPCISHWIGSYGEANLQNIMSGTMDSLLLPNIPQRFTDRFPDIRQSILTIDFVHNLTDPRYVTEDSLGFLLNALESDNGQWGIVTNVRETGGHWVGLVLEKKGGVSRWYFMDSGLGDQSYAINTIVKLFNETDPAVVRKKLDDIMFEGPIKSRLVAIDKVLIALENFKKNKVYYYQGVAELQGPEITRENLVAAEIDPVELDNIKAGRKDYVMSRAGLKVSFWRRKDDPTKWFVYLENSDWSILEIIADRATPAGKKPYSLVAFDYINASGDTEQFVTKIKSQRESVKKIYSDIRAVFVRMKTARYKGHFLYEIQALTERLSKLLENRKGIVAPEDIENLKKELGSYLYDESDASFDSDSDASLD